MFLPMTLEDFTRQFLTSHHGWELKDMWYHAQYPQYVEHQIPKKQLKKNILVEGTDVIAQKMRIIHEPCPGLKILHQFILNRILNPAVDCLLPCAHGCVPKRNTVTNAIPHVGSRIKIHMDLKDFFPSVNVKRIYGMFLKTFKYEMKLAWLLANLCAYKGKAPQGAATSPMICNIISTPLDRRLIWLASSHGGYYTRYVDDLTFSFRPLMSNHSIDLFIRAVRKTVKSQGFRVNEEKTSVVSSGDRMVVTGVVVNTLPSVPLWWRKNVRASLHQHRLGCPSADPSEVIHGRLSYINGINPTQARSIERAHLKAKSN